MYSFLKDKFSFKALVFDLFTFGCYSGYMNIKRLEELHKHHRIKTTARP